MKIKYHYSTEENIVFVYPEGSLYLADIIEYLNAIMENPDIKPGFIELVDFSKVEDFQFSFKSALKLPKIFTNLKEKKQHAATLLVGNNELRFGMARMFTSILDNYITICPVCSLEEAKEKIIDIRKTSNLDS